jgi:UDP-N-acetylglucosamine 4,6-dehydratase/5-epimerase
VFEGKKILITGGTGSLGSALVKKLLKFKVDVIRIYSRDELKQVMMRSNIPDKRLRFLIGDVRDKERLQRALKGIDIIFHTAALKHVPVAEYNPFEFIKTNVYGTQNVVDAGIDNEVELIVGIGTDKAVSPLNTYGATKLLMEKIMVSANYYKGDGRTKSVCVRYGNVLGSRGSIVPVLHDQIMKNNEITITDSNMTRFNITMDQAIDLVFRAAKEGKGGEIFVPKLKAYRVEDIKNAIVEIMNKKPSIKKIDVRPGEKYDEILISKGEIRNTYESSKDYIIYNEVGDPLFEKPKIPYKKSKLKEDYSSAKTDRFTKEELKTLILKEKFLFMKEK